MQVIKPFAVALVLVLTPLADAQWSQDPAVNLSVADAASDQILAKLAPTPDGGTWISWYDGIGTGFDVRIQKLDAQGVEVFAHAGLLVVDRGFSSVQDYALDLDASGNALLVFRDDSGAGVQITAAKVTALGALAWGASGVQLTSTTAFVAAPKICGTSDGGAVVAWTQNSSARVRKINAGGALEWASDVVLTPGVGSYSPSDLHDHGTDAILSFVHQSGGFGSPRHLLTQKFNSLGAPLWGASHVAVFDGGSLQFGNFPTFVPDGSGGAVFSWYDTASVQFQVYAQHVLPGGAEAFPHNGSAGSTNATRERVSPSATYDPVSGHTFMFWEEQTMGQSGLYGQKFSAGGARTWGASGIQYVPLGSASLTTVRTLAPFAPLAGVEVAWSVTPSFGTDQLFAARVDPAGTFDVGPFDLASTPSVKSRLAVARATTGDALYVWTDDRVDSGDVLAQSVNCAGGLGSPGASYCTAGTTANGCTASISAAGFPSATLSSGFELTASGVEGNKDGLFFYGSNGKQANAWGNGSSFQCVVPPVQRAGLISGTGTSGACDGVFTQDLNARWCPTCPKPGQNPGAGAVVQAQLWFRDPSNTSNQTTSLSDAVQFTVCP